MRARAELAALVALVALAPVVAACSSWSTGSGSGDEAEQACNAIIDAYARAAERCGDDYKTRYDALVRESAGGDCKNVRAIRDERALRETCIPFVRSLTCAELDQGRTDPSCTAQLERTAGLVPALQAARAALPRRSSR
jgi:hypothetical protein